MLFKHLTSVSFLCHWIDPASNIHGLAVAMVSLHSIAMVIGCWGDYDRQGSAWIGSSLWPSQSVVYLFLFGGLWINSHNKESWTVEPDCLLASMTRNDLRWMCEKEKLGENKTPKNHKTFFSSFSYEGLDCLVKLNPCSGKRPDCVFCSLHERTYADLIPF